MFGPIFILLCVENFLHRESTVISYVMKSLIPSWSFFTYFSKYDITKEKFDCLKLEMKTLCEIIIQVYKVIFPLYFHDEIVRLYNVRHVFVIVS